jgi:hypothetical protein
MSETQHKQLGKLEFISVSSTTTLYHALFRENTPSYVTTELSNNHIKECYSNIVGEIKNNLNHLGICHSNTQQPDNESSLQLLKQAIEFSNTTCGKYGIEIHDIADWPEKDHLHTEFVSITNEIAIILTLAFNFSSQSTPLQLLPPKDYVKLAENEDIKGAIARAVLFRSPKVN